MTLMDGDANPLLSDSPEIWDRLIESVGPASLLTVIHSRMTEALLRRTTAEDIWQEALLHVWRDRAGHEWRGLRNFRAWLLSIIDHRIRDAAVQEQAAKRGGGNPPIAFSALAPPGSQDARGSSFPLAIASTTPSRIAMYREQAAVMQVVLAELPDPVREVVRLRIFEQLPLDEIAGRLGLGVSAVRHRFRAGAEQYHQRLRVALAGRSRTDK
jgi:RNA polymerase sigma factor (sigma-70 family)